VILVGGESRRMGRDKLLLEVGGAPLVRRVHEALTLRCAEVILVGGGGAPLEGVRRVPDDRTGGQGPLAGLESGFAAAINRLVFAAAGDLPFLPADLVGFLLDRLEDREACAAVPRHGGRTHPLCAAYDRRILPQVRSALDRGVSSVRGFLGGLDRVYYAEEELQRFGDPDLFLMNVNSPRDLERARREAAP
jgi:molybdopterin-guanine dinucleotide biosynthesis protein A